MDDYSAIERERQDGYAINGQALDVARGTRSKADENAGAAAHSEGPDYAQALKAENRKAIKIGKAEKVVYETAAQRRARRKGLRVGHGSLNTQRDT